jgi:midasin (ATPase involved in ribosome maturation)
MCACRLLFRDSQEYGVQALEAGEWLLVDNVNFCSPTVLDRLNALLEPHGVLQITERGVVDGAIQAGACTLERR